MRLQVGAGDAILKNTAKIATPLLQSCIFTLVNPIDAPYHEGEE